MPSVFKLDFFHIIITLTLFFLSKKMYALTIMLVLIDVFFIEQNKYTYKLYNLRNLVMLFKCTLIYNQYCIQ